MENHQNDLLRNVGISVIASAKLVGGPLSFLLDKAMPEQASQQLDTFLLDLTVALQQFDETELMKKIQTPEFTTLFLKVIGDVCVDYQNKKAKVYQNIIVHSLSEYNTMHESMYFLHLLDFFPRTTLGYLYFIYKNEILASKGINAPYLKTSGKFTLQDFYVMSVGAELCRYRLMKGTKELTPLGIRFCDSVFRPYEIEDDFDFEGSVNINE